MPWQERCGARGGCWCSWPSRTRPSPTRTRPPTPPPGPGTGGDPAGRHRRLRAGLLPGRRHRQVGVQLRHQAPRALQAGRPRRWDRHGGRRGVPHLPLSAASRTGPGHWADLPGGGDAGHGPGGVAVVVLTYRPDPSEFAWTFGGVKPVRSVKPGTVLELWTEDAFAGRVRGPDDLVSKVIQFPFVNPQTGPFFVEGAEPGDTLAVHFVSIEPSRDWAASTTVPLFGSLTSTHATATLQEPLPEVVWIYQVDAKRRTVTYRATRGDHS